MRPFRILGVMFTLVFALLFAVRIGLVPSPLRPAPAVAPRAEAIRERDTWMKIMQDGEKIGYSHTVFSRAETGYHLQETVYMTLNTMGLTQSIRLFTDARLNKDLSLASFETSISSGRFVFRAEGEVKPGMLGIRTESAGDVRRMEIPVKDKLYLAAGIMEAMMASGLTVGDQKAYYIFDPATMSRRPVTVKVLGKEEIEVMGMPRTGTKVTVEFKGISQTAWIGENGEILKEKGLLGLRMERTGPEDARAGITTGRDLAMIASVPSNVTFESPEKLRSATYRISGIDWGRLEGVHGGRQTLNGRMLTIVRENMEGLQKTGPGTGEKDSISKPGSQGPLKTDTDGSPKTATSDSSKKGTEEKKPPEDFLSPSPFIQSDHPLIRKTVRQIVSHSDSGFARVEKIVSWIHDNIDRRPVLSVPDALSTLKNRAGDCNEHSVLLAALAKASGVPARVEAGLVYLKGRFYYHAWNQVFVGKWITVDSLFNQVPADVTHIRITRGTQEMQTDILALIGKVKIEVVRTE